MEKNKLGIVISTTKSNNRTSGFRTIYSYNSDRLSSGIRDTGAELKMVTNDSASAPIHFIQFENDGCCYCVIQSIAGRKDYQSAWIFIHKDIMLPTGTLVSVIKRVEEILSLDPEDNMAELDELFSTSYPTTDNPSYSASTGDSYAVRYYGNGTDFMYTRQQVLEENLYQSAYCRYKSVFLVDKESGQTISGVDDLTNTKLEKSHVIELPDEIDGFRHDLGSNSRRITNGDTIRVRWTRAGYSTIVKKGSTKEELMIKKSEYHRSFRLSLFRVVDKVTKKELNPTIRFNIWSNKDTTGNFIFFKEGDLTNVPYTVELKTYVTAKGWLDLTSPNEQGLFVIELQPEEHVYKCSLKTNIPDCPEVTFSIHTRCELSGNEIPGLRFKGLPSEKSLNTLEEKSPQIKVDHKESLPAPYGETNDVKRGHRGVPPSPKPKAKKRAPWYQYALLILVILGMLGGCYYFFCYDKEDKVTVEADSNVDSYPETEWDKAFGYLKDHDKDSYWEQDGMDSFSELNGVYTMIKDYQFKDLKLFIEEHSNDLMQLDSWKRLYDNIQDRNDKKGSFYAPDRKMKKEDYFNKVFKRDENTKSPVPSDFSDGAKTSEAGNAKLSEKGEKKTNGKDGAGGKGGGKGKAGGKGKGNEKAGGKGNKNGTESNTQDGLN